jgi:uncharacterized protein (DUF1778 family)
MTRTGAASIKIKGESDKSLIATQMRFDKQGLAKIDRAAELLGSTRSEFVRRSAVVEAEKVLLDQVYFGMDRTSFDFFDSLTKASPSGKPFENLMSCKSPWDKI